MESHGQISTEPRGDLRPLPKKHFPDYTLPLVIRSDASDHTVGAVLFKTTLIQMRLEYIKLSLLRPTDSPALLLIGTPSSKKPTICITLSPNLSTISVVNRNIQSRPRLDRVKPNPKRCSLVSPPAKLHF